MLKDPRYQNKSEAFLKIYAPQLCKPDEDSVYDELEYNMIENPRWEVPPEEDNQNTEENGNEFYALVYNDQFTNNLSTPCNNYYESLSEDNDVSDNELDVSDKEMYNEFDNEVKPEKETFLSPRTIKDAPWIHQGSHRIQYLSRSVRGRIIRPHLVHGKFPVSRFTKPPKQWVSAGFPSRIIISKIAKSLLLSCLAKSSTSHVQPSK